MELTWKVKWDANVGVINTITRPTMMMANRDDVPFAQAISNVST